MAAAVFLLGLAACDGAAADRLTVTDGDGLRLNGERIRLWGIDAPELDQTCERDGRPYHCGEEARDVLGGLVQGGAVSCETVEQDRYGRTVARCGVDGRDLGGELVRLGWALDFRRYSEGAYAEQEGEARIARRGLWAGNFLTPALWRERH